MELQFITTTYLPDWALVSSRLSTQHNQNSLWEQQSQRWMSPCDCSFQPAVRGKLSSPALSPLLPLQQRKQCRWVATFYTITRFYSWIFFHVAKKTWDQLTCHGKKMFTPSRVLPGTQSPKCDSLTLPDSRVWTYFWTKQHSAETFMEKYFFQKHVLSVKYVEIQTNMILATCEPSSKRAADESKQLAEQYHASEVCVW